MTPTLQQNMDTTKNSLARNISIVWGQALQKMRIAANEHLEHHNDAKVAASTESEWKDCKLAMTWLQAADKLVKEFPPLKTEGEVKEPAEKEIKAAPEEDEEEPLVLIEKDEQQ